MEKTEERPIKKIVGKAYDKLQDLVKDYAKADEPVLFIGETGTGKELFMQLYMKENQRIDEKKMTVNCAAFSDELLRSEVFGHVKGAYTGAIKDRPGRIEACQNGILALDEIGDATPEFQAAILRVCEGYSFSRMGDNKEIKNTNTLIIAATNKPENLRHDLKQRFHIIPIPTLQKEDIPALANHFLEGSLTEEVIKELQSREYPGNIRELEKTCKRLKVERKGKIFSKNDVDPPPYNFDYNRFRREMNTWNRYIQPLIDYYGKEYKFDRYKYKYMPWDEDPLHWILDRDEWINPGNVTKDPTEDEETTIRTTAYGFTCVCYLKRSINEEYDIPFSERIQFTTKKDLLFSEKDNQEEDKEEYIKDFKNAMRYIFDSSTLPCFLGYIYLKAELPADELQTTIAQPHLSYLLDLKWNDAKKELFKHYYAHNVKKHADTAELKTAVGMTKKSLNQKYKEYQKHKQSHPSDSSLK